jgi:hypothetical protein
MSGLTGFAEVDTIAVVDESFEGPNGDRSVDLAPAAGRFTRGAAHPTTSRSKGIGFAGDQIGTFIFTLADGGDISSAVGPNWTCELASYGALIIRKILKVDRITGHGLPPFKMVTGEGLDSV